MIYEFEDISPKLAAGCFVAPNAVVIGDVALDERASVWFNCAVRGDLNKITIGKGSNIQDGAVIHISSGRSGCVAGATIIGDGVTVGHGAIIHACTLGDGCLVGMGAMVLDEAVVAGGAFIAAGAVVLPGARVGRGELWAGNPAIKKRMVGDKERQMIEKTPIAYAKLAARHAASGKSV